MGCIRVSLNTNLPLEVCDPKRSGSDGFDPVPQPPERRADLLLAFIFYARQRLQFQKCCRFRRFRITKLNLVTAPGKAGVGPAHSALPGWAQPAWLIGNTSTNIKQLTS